MTAIGRLELICGPMFSGKTDELIRRFESARDAGEQVVAIKPLRDSRHPVHLIVSHSGHEIPAHAARSALEIDGLAAGTSGVFIDEIQFFDEPLFGAINSLRSAGINVIVAGLDQDFRRRPFEVVALLVGRASSVAMLSAVCTRCGRVASTTQRFQNGKPASLRAARLVVGDAGVYEPRCTHCWELERA